MERRVQLTAFLIAALAGAASALAQPVWVEEGATSDEPKARSGEQRRVEVRVQARDDDSDEADDVRPQQRRRVVREQRIQRDDAGPGGPRVMILDDQEPRQARKSAKRKAQASRRGAAGPGGQGREEVEIRIEGPDGAKEMRRPERLRLHMDGPGAGPRGGEDREVIILRDDEVGPRGGGGGPQVHRFAFPGGEGRVMVFRGGPDGPQGGHRGSGPRSQAGPHVFEFRGGDGGRWTMDGPQTLERRGGGHWTPKADGPRIKVRGPRGGDGPVRVQGRRMQGSFEVEGHRLSDENGNIMFFRHGPGDGPGADMFFRELPGQQGGEHEVIIRKGGRGDEAPRRVRIQRMDGSGGDPQPGQCPNCNCI